MKKQDSHHVLCVDLDGTLILTDSLQEGLLLFVRKNVLHIFLIFYWLCFGRAFLKQQIFQRVDIDPSTLPYNTDLLDWIRECKRLGQKIVLVTATDQRYAAAVSEYLGVFDEVLASDGKRNLRSRQKAAVLNQHYGRKQYDYAGNSTADLAVWREAHSAVVVNAHASLLGKVRNLTQVQKIFKRPKLSIRLFLKTIRVHQYAKNVLILLPLFAGHALTNRMADIQALIGFGCFCLLASAVYLINDLLDIPADRKHPHKTKRAIPSGLLPIPYALIWAVLFLSGSILLASLALPCSFLSVLAGYALLTFVYSLWLKRVVLADVMTLALLYTARVVAGMTLLSNTNYSLWMLLFSLFIFLSLAFLKRVSELHLLQKHGQKKIAGRAYHAKDLEVFTLFGVSSGFIGILVFALYLNSDAAEALYAEPQRLILVFPFLLYWLCRIWLLATQGKVHEDPVLYTIRDKTSYGIGLLVLGVFVWAMY